MLAMGITCIGMSHSMIAEAADTEFSINIVHTNDIHGSVVEDVKGNTIGMAKLKSMIDANEGTADDQLVLDSGDYFHGKTIATLDKGESVRKLIDLCGYDAMAVGNHDWNYGVSRLKELEGESQVKFLSGNTITDGGSPFFAQESMIREVEKDGKTLRIGIFGVIDDALKAGIALRNIEGIDFQEIEPYANQMASTLRNEGCDVVIALVHGNKIPDLARRVNGVDLWLGGHELIVAEETVTTPEGKPAVVYEEGSNLSNVGMIHVNVNLNDEEEVENLDIGRTLYDYEAASGYVSDPNVEALIAQIQEEQDKELHKVVGTTPIALDGGWESLRIGETNMGRVVTRAYLDGTGADIAFENAGGIRASVNAGDVTYQDILDISPYGNMLVVKSISGNAIKEVLETSIDIQIANIEAYNKGEYDGWPINSGSYLQVGGMTVQYDLTKEKGSRVISVKVGDEEFDPNKDYTVALNNFLTGNEDYPQFSAVKDFREYRKCEEVLVAFFEKGSDVIMQAAEKENMIQVKEEPVSPGEDDQDDGTDTDSKDNKSGEIDTKPSSNKKVPKTGDDHQMEIYMLLTMMALFVGAYTKVKNLPS